jgi:hypothetical protein
MHESGLKERALKTGSQTEIGPYATDFCSTGTAEQNGSLIKQILIFALFFVAVSATYGLVTSPDYAFADDFYYLGTRLTSPDWFASILAATNLQGRPIVGLLIASSVALFGSLGDFVYLHIFAILATACLSYLVYYLASQSGWTQLQSICLALALVSLPPFQVVVAWSTAGFFVLAVIFALLSVRTITRVGPGKLTPGFVVSILALLVALTIYQPAAMFYWPFAAICLTGNSFNGKQKWSALLRLLVVFFVAAFLDLMVFELAKLHYGTAALLPQRSHLTMHPAQKLSWFIGGPIVDVLNFNNLLPSRRLALCSAVFIFAGLLLYFKPNRQRGLFSFLPLLVVFVLIPLSYFPNLAIAENFYTYRTELGLGALMLFYAALAAKAFSQKFVPPQQQALTLTTVMGLACILNLLSAHDHIRDFFVQPQLLELKMVKSQLMGDYGPERQKHPLLLERTQSLAPFIRYDEFGLPSFSCPWVKEPGIFLLKEEVKNSGRTHLEAIPPA